MIKNGIEKCLVRANLIPADLLVDRFERCLLSGDLERELYKKMFQRPFRFRNKTSVMRIRIIFSLSVMQFQTFLELSNNL